MKGTVEFISNGFLIATCRIRESKGEVFRCGDFGAELLRSSSSLDIIHSHLNFKTVLMGQRQKKSIWLGS